jgi:hypothetical protein
MIDKKKKPRWDDNPCGFCEGGMCDECDAEDCTCRANGHDRSDML